MKIFIFLGLKSFVLFFLFTLMLSCQKEPRYSIADLQSNIIMNNFNDSKSSQALTLVIDLGHDAKKCSGCILRDGQMIHLNCQGHGNACRVSTNVTLNTNVGIMYVTTTDTFGLTDQSIFNMPDRSLYAGKDEKGNDLWLNIPAQLVYRDSTSLQFTFNGLFYSNTQHYSNR